MLQRSKNGDGYKIHQEITPLQHVALLLSFFVIYLITMSVTRARRPRRIQPAYLWFVLLWTVSAILNVISPLSYYNDISATTVTFVILAHLAFAGGTIARIFSVRFVEKVYFKTETDPLPRNLYLLIGAVGCACQILVIIDKLTVLGIDVNSAFSMSELGTVRTANFEGTGSILGLLAFPVYTLSSLCYVTLTMFAYSYGNRIRGVSLISAGAAVAVAAFALLLFYHLFILAGRGPLIFMSISMVFAYATGRREAGRRPLPLYIWPMAVLCFFPLSMASTYLQIARDAGATNPLIAMYVVMNARPAEWLIDAAASSEIVAFFLVQIGYLTSSLNLYEFYSGLGSAFPGPYLGSYNFTTPSRILLGPFGLHFDFWDIREELFLPLTSMGHQGNVWTTIIRDFVADFGYLGALIALAIFGYVLQSAEDHLQFRPSPLKASLVAFLRMICVWSYFHSLFFVEYLLMAVLLTVGLIMLFPYSQARAVSSHVGA